ncbi:hypothetical protein [uncultured Roseibium sp.]|uniref:hypothetical protein n=1 Tax=uncultured Roseibium sp. TaxID=1936171 RepID=UPI00262530D8|nr:hypothetical protein [uncultured Roseibium sp.]
MTPANIPASTSRTAEQRAQDVVHRIVSQAEAIPMHHGGGHKLDMQLLYDEVVAALRETIDDLAYCSET